MVAIALTARWRAERLYEEKAPLGRRGLGLGDSNEAVAFCQLGAAFL